MSVEHLLGSLLTCGSHRLSAMMYKVVRKLLVPKKCYLCGTLGKCTRLPGMTAIKSNAKPMSKDWYAKHDLLQLTVDESCWCRDIKLINFRQTRPHLLLS